MFFRRHFIKVLILLVVVLSVATGILYRKTFISETAKDSEAEYLVEKVGKLIILPTDEVPTIATVSNLEALKGQAFFVGAKNGDKVLIYTKAQKAVLYDPILNKIVNVAPLNIED